MSDKNKAVSLYTEQALSKADNSILNKAQLNFLLKKTPTEHIKSRPAKGGGTWQYVKGNYVKKILNFMFGFRWSFTIVERDYIPLAEQVVVHGRLKVIVVKVDGSREEIVKEQFGKADIKYKVEWKKVGGKNTKVRAKNHQGEFIPLDFGNDCKAAATDALKKCATELGLFSDVYSPDDYIEVQVVDEEQTSIDDQEKIRELTMEIVEDLDRVKDASTVDGFRDMLLKKQNTKEFTIEFATNVRDEIKTIIDEQ